MYSILLSPHATMIVVSQLSIEYPVFMALNYEVLATGTKRSMEKQLEEMDLQTGW